MITVTAGPLVPGWVWAGRFPQGDEDALSRISDAWQEAADAATERGTAVTKAFDTLSASHTGPAADSAQAKATSVAQWFDQLSTSASSLADATAQAAGLIMQAKTAINVVLMNLQLATAGQVAATLAKPAAGLLEIRRLQLAAQAQIVSLYDGLVQALAALSVTVDLTTTADPDLAATRAAQLANYQASGGDPDDFASLFDVSASDPSERLQDKAEEASGVHANDAVEAAGAGAREGFTDADPEAATWNNAYQSAYTPEEMAAMSKEAQQALTEGNTPTEADPTELAQRADRDVTDTEISTELLDRWNTPSGGAASGLDAGIPDPGSTPPLSEGDVLGGPPSSHPSADPGASSPVLRPDPGQGATPAPDSPPRAAAVPASDTPTTRAVSESSRQWTPQAPPPSGSNSISAPPPVHHVSGPTAPPVPAPTGSISISSPVPDPPPTSVPRVVDDWAPSAGNESLRPIPDTPPKPGSTAAGIGGDGPGAPPSGTSTGPAPGPVMPGGAPAAPTTGAPPAGGPNLTSAPMSVSGGAPAAPTSAMGAPPPQAPAPAPPAAGAVPPAAQASLGKAGLSGGGLPVGSAPPAQPDPRMVQSPSHLKAAGPAPATETTPNSGPPPETVGAVTTLAAGGALLGSIARDLRIPPPVATGSGTPIAWPTQFGPDDSPLASLPPGWDVVYQRVLLPGESEAMLAGLVTTLRGLVYPYEQVRDLVTPQALFDVLGLGYTLNEGTGHDLAAFQREADHVDVIRCNGIPAADLVIPLASDVAPPDDTPIPATVRDHARPWAGTGEAPGSSSTAHIDEFEILGTWAGPIPHLAEIWRLHADGHSSHVATWDARHAQWLGAPAVATRPPVGRRLENGRFATFRDNTTFAMVLLSEDESVLIAPDHAAPSQFVPAVDGSRRFIVDNASIVALHSVTTLANWQQTPVQVLRRHDAMALVDCAADTRAAAAAAGFNQLAQGQWQTRWVPWSELSALQEEERHHDAPCPALVPTS